MRQALRIRVRLLLHTHAYNRLLEQIKLYQLKQNTSFYKLIKDINWNHYIKLNLTY